jgi:hypothetical protein
MGDRFDSTNYPTTEPRELVVGDRWVWKRTDLTDYPPATYDLSYLLRDVNDGTREITITASESGTDYLVEVASSTTSGYVPGRYRWLAYITRTSDSERMTLASGYTEVVPNTGGENVETLHMDFLRERVRVLRTAIVQLQSKTVTSYSIGDRTLTYQDIPTMVTEYNKAMGQSAARRHKVQPCLRDCGTASPAPFRHRPSCVRQSLRSVCTRAPRQAVLQVDGARPTRAPTTS